jgi:tripartite-type tricarboxylate transporter receptor subunit TctC
MAESMGQQIVIDNQPGAAGLIGTERFMRSTPDGYTLATLNDSILTMIPNLYKKVACDPLKSFAPVSLVAFNTWLLVNHPSLPVKSARELVALARRVPAKSITRPGARAARSISRWRCSRRRPAPK